MVLHEIWSLGHKPFNDLSNPIVRAIISNTTIVEMTACVCVLLLVTFHFFFHIRSLHSSTVSTVRLRLLVALGQCIS